MLGRLSGLGWSGGGAWFFAFRFGFDGFLSRVDLGFGFQGFDFFPKALASPLLTPSQFFRSFPSGCHTVSSSRGHCMETRMKVKVRVRVRAVVPDGDTLTGSFRPAYRSNKSYDVM